MKIKLKHTYADIYDREYLIIYLLPKTIIKRGKEINVTYRYVAVEKGDIEIHKFSVHGKHISQVYDDDYSDDDDEIAMIESSRNLVRKIHKD